MKRVKLFLSVLALSLLFSSLAQAQLPRLKTLVFEPDVKKRKDGFAISVVRHISNPDGTEQRQVMGLRAATKVFYKTGDKITFEIRSNFDGYVYVLHRDVKNRYFVLYPRQEKANRQNKIKSCTEPDYLKCKPFVFPQGGKFTFRPPKGNEHVAFVITKKRLFHKDIKKHANHYGFVAQSEEDRSKIQQEIEQQNRMPKTGTETLASESAPNPYAQVLANKKGLYNKKTLVFEADAQAEPRSDIVVLPEQNLEPQTTSLMFIRFFLVHN